MTISQVPLRRVLLTNDDGIDAPGLAALEALAGEIAEEVWTVAPMQDQSGTSHALSMHHPLRLNQRGERRYAVTGTPSDCVVMGLREVLADNPPDLVLSGINHGMNTGHEVMYSGTASAAVTATWMGFRAIAMSQAFRHPSPIDFAPARQHGAELVRRMFAADWPSGICLNVNFPAVAVDQVAGMRLTRQGREPIFQVAVEGRVDVRGQHYFWLGFRPSGAAQAPGTDIAALKDRMVSITPLRFDRSDEAAIERLSDRFG